LTDVARAAPGRAAGRPPSPPVADAAPLIGLAAGAACIGAAVAMGGSATGFVNAPSILIVLGGTLAVTTMSFRIAEIAALPGIMLRTLVRRPIDAAAAARRVLGMAERARKKGPLALQAELSRTIAEPLLRSGLALAADGATPEEIERALNAEAAAAAARQRTAADVMRKAAEVAPAMGLIGTLVGLVQMLGHLADPDTIGPAMAVALLTTLYGAVLANMVLLPLAAKLERNALHDALVDAVHVTGVLSMSRLENPRRLETLVNALLPPAQRVRYFD
jgi:chemotaxis protein MotA